MQLDVVHRDPTQVIGIYKNVCLIVRWAQFSASDLAVHLSSLAMVRERSPSDIAVLQVNRFTPGPAKPGLDDAAQRAVYELVRAHGPALKIYALVLADLPFWVSSIRSIYARMSLHSRVQINLRPFTDLQKAIHAVCSAMSGPGRGPLERAELVAALDELERQRPTSGAAAR